MSQSINMLGREKSKRVSWATGENLCQVKLFLSDDPPSQVGAGTEDHLQPKQKNPFLYNSGSVAAGDDGLPPGFEEVNPEVQLLKNKLALIPLAKWKCPPKFSLDESWRVAAGEESTEVETQNQRESRVLEAIYPRPSDIPPNPAISADAANSCDDSKAILVPITAVDEDDPPEPVGQPGQQTLIDHELLVKFLSDPAFLEEFVKRQENPLPPPPPHFTQNLPSPTVNPQGQFYPQPILQHPPPIIPTAAQSTSTHPPKDMNYFKTLIQQHGYGQLQAAAPPPPFMAQHGQVHGPPPNPNPNPNPNPMENKNNNNHARPTREPKSKFMKPCIFFNTAKGCRHGASCAYQHDMTLQQRSSSAPEMHGNKRVKMNREMRGTQSYN